MTIHRITRPKRPRTFYGKYRAAVADNLDPLKMGRVLATCPAISNNPLTWAMPCVPWGGPQTGMFIVPPVGAGVWIEFEQGDIDYPIWTGCFWSDPAEVPVLADSLFAQPGIALAGEFQTGITLGAGQTGTGSITLQCADTAIIISAEEGIVIRSGAARIAVQLDQIEITNGVASVVIAGPTVTVNDGALEVL